MVPDMPPPPPIQRSEPLDHIVRMADENAAFFYNNQRISSMRAIELMKKNSTLYVETEMFEKSNPIVKILDTYAPPPLTQASLAPLPAEDPAKIIQEMAKKGATFYSGDEKISDKEAIQLVRKVENMKIEVIDPDSKNPVVKLSGC